MDASYQLVIQGAPLPDRREALSDTVAGQLRNLGLDPASYLRIVGDDEPIDWRMPLAAVWLAEEGVFPPTGRLDELLRRSAGVFSVVSAGADAEAVVPRQLRHLNAYVWDPEHARLGAALVAALGLAGDERKAFLSYRRSDARSVAVQLFHRLSDRGYAVFLDTASLRPGADVLAGLTDRMADSDLLVFLDTPGALSSRWVERELTQAHNLGLGVLQLVWPGRPPFAGTELSTAFRLRLSDFEPEPEPAPVAPGGAADPQASLTTGALAVIADAAERVRMRSLASRRARLVGEIAAAARRYDLDVAVTPAGPVTITKAGAQVARAIPVVGPPGSAEIYAARDLFVPEGTHVRLVYDGLGVLPERRGYLSWLNRELARYQTVSIDELARWLPGVA